MLKAQKIAANTAVSTSGRTIAGRAAGRTIAGAADAATGITMSTANDAATGIATRTVAILLAAVMALAVTLVAGGAQKAYAAEDLTQYITINSVEVFDSDGQSIPLNQGDDASSYSSGLAMGENGKFQFTWSINTGTSQIQEGDTVTLPIKTTLLRFNSFTATDIYGTIDGSEQKIGTIQRAGATEFDGNLIITFSDAAIGHNSITNGHFSTGNVLRRAGAVQNGTVRSFTFNNTEYKYLAEPSLLTPIPRTATKWQDGHSSTNVRFGIIPFRSIERDLTDVSNAANITDATWVNANLRHSDVFIEDVIDDSGVSSVSINGITVPIYVPLGDTVSTSANNATIGWVSIKTRFTEITQQDGETIDAFKTRVKSNPLQYGVYEENGVFTVMINLGDWPTNTLTYDNTNVTSAVENAPNTNDYWNNDRVGLWKSTHLQSALNGEITTPSIYVNVVYDKPVVVETQKTNTAQLYMDGNEPTNMSARGTLLPTTQTATAKAGEVQIIKMDADTNEALSGVEFELERHDGTDWVKYTPVGGGQNSWTTDANGSAIIGGLIGGNEYRLVETAASDGYDKDSLKLYTDTSLSTRAGSFTVDSSKGLILYATNEKAQAPATYGDVVIQKKLAGNDADSGASKAFKFTVTAEDKDGAAIEGTFGDAAFADGTATVTITGEGTATIAGLPDGAIYTIAEADYSSEGWDAVSWDTEPVDKTITGASPNSSVTYTATNARNTYGELVVTKAVAGNAADKTKAFDFTVTLTQADGMELANTAVGDDTTDAEGKVSFSLKGGESKTIKGIPNGTKYEVAEADYSADGYEVTKTGDTGTIAGGENSSVTAEFTNTKSYAPAKVDPPVSKVVEGTTDVDPFTYTLKAISGPNGMTVASMPMPQGSANGQKQITENGAGDYEFGEFELPLPGTYVYEVAEEAGSLDYDYDDSKYTVTYVVAAGADGVTLGVSTTIAKDGEEAGKAVFTNVKKAGSSQPPADPDPDPGPGSDPDPDPGSDPDPDPGSDPDPDPGSDPDPDPGLDPDPGTDPDPDPVDPAPKTPLLSISKTSAAKQAKPGDVVPYVITITNSGEGDAQGVEIVDTMAEDLSYVEDDAGGKADGQKVTWLVDVPAGGSKTINIKCSIKESATGKVINSVAITPSDGFEVEPQKEEDDETITISTGDGSTFDPNAQEEEKNTPDKDPGKVVTTGTGGNKDTNTSASKPSPSRTTTAATGDAASPLALVLLLVVSGVALVASRTRRAKE